MYNVRSFMIYDEYDGYTYTLFVFLHSNPIIKNMTIKARVLYDSKTNVALYFGRIYQP